MFLSLMMLMLTILYYSLVFQILSRNKYPFEIPRLGNSKLLDRVYPRELNLKQLLFHMIQGVPRNMTVGE